MATTSETSLLFVFVCLSLLGVTCSCPSQRCGRGDSDSPPQPPRAYTAWTKRRVMYAYLQPLWCSVSCAPCVMSCAVCPFSRDSKMASAQNKGVVKAVISCDTIIVMGVPQVSLCPSRYDWGSLPLCLLLLPQHMCEMCVQRSVPSGSEISALEPHQDSPARLPLCARFSTNSAIFSRVRWIQHVVVIEPGVRGKDELAACASVSTRNST